VQHPRRAEKEQELLIYFVLLIGAVAAGVPFCKKRDGEQNKLLVKIYLALVFLALFIIAAIRKSTGYDYNLYATWYNRLVFMNYEQLMAWSREKGFTVPLRILTVITRDFQPMFVIISFIIAAGVVVYIYKNSSSAYISVAAFISFGLYYNSMNFMRQIIAAIIVSFALNYIDSKQPLRYFILVLFASTMHFSALLMLPFYFILMIKMNYIVLGVYAAVSVVTFIFSEPIVEFATGYFYTEYVLDNPHMTAGLPVEYTVIFGIMFALYFIFRKDLIKKRSLNSILINAYWFAVYFEFIGIKHSVLSRFALLFLVAPLLALTPDLIQVIIEKIQVRFANSKGRDIYAEHYTTSNSKARVFSVLAVAAFCIYGLTVHTVLILNNYNGVVPYRTVYNYDSIDTPGGNQ
jgi:hypothetical protein